MVIQLNHTERPVQLPTECTIVQLPDAAVFYRCPVSPFRKGAGAEREPGMNTCVKRFAMREVFPDDRLTPPVRDLPAKPRRHAHRCAIFIKAWIKFNQIRRRIFRYGKTTAQLSCQHASGSGTAGISDEQPSRSTSGAICHHLMEISTVVTSASPTVRMPPPR